MHKQGPYLLISLLDFVHLIHRCDGVLAVCFVRESEGLIFMHCFLENLFGVDLQERENLGCKTDTLLIVERVFDSWRLCLSQRGQPKRLRSVSTLSSLALKG